MGFRAKIGPESIVESSVVCVHGAVMKRSRAEKPVIVKKVIKNITINNTYNINKYFAPQPGPAPAPDAQPEAPPHLFPDGEREIRAPHVNPRYGTYRRVRSTQSGGLFGDCGNCTRMYKDIAEFAPDDCLQNVRSRPDFFAAVEAYNAAYEARDLEGAREARDTINAMRSRNCPSCRKTDNKLTGPKKACRDCWIELRQEACARGGCIKEGCCENGPTAWQVLEADHLVPEDKTHILSDYVWWAWNGGPAAMRAEAAKCQWICRFCHFLEPTSAAANRCGDPAAMPDGKSSGTEEETKQYDAKRRVKIVHPKQEYVDAEKLRRGRCLTCEREVTSTNAFGFQFDHRDETTKMKGKDTIAGVNGGVAGLVHNHTKRAALPKIKDVLDAEMAKCDLLCANCHKRKTWGYEEEADGED